LLDAAISGGSIASIDLTVSDEELEIICEALQQREHNAESQPDDERLKEIRQVISATADAAERRQEDSGISAWWSGRASRRTRRQRLSRTNCSTRS
jgi:hypothetical protein